MKNQGHVGAPVLLDLFAGAGGTSLGFREAGFRIVAAVELDPSAAETFARNLNGKLHVGDIRLLEPRSFRESLNLNVGDLHVLVGCPPCQGFSRMRNSDGAADERNGLILHYLAFVAEFRPVYAFFENVPGILTTEHGRAYYDRLTGGLRDLGYGVTMREVNAADFGVPQNRNRTILLAGRDGVVPPFPYPTHGDPESNVVSEGFRQPWRTVRDAIAPYQTLCSAAQANHVSAQTGPDVTQFIRQVPKNGGSRIDVPREHWLECHRYHAGHKDVYGRASWDRPSNTVTGGCTNPSKGRFVHPEEDRGFTFREAAALQGFPDEFVFHGCKVASQIGNAVPPPLAAAFAEILHRELRRRAPRIAA